MASLSFEKCTKFLVEKMMTSAVEAKGLFSETCTNGELIDLKITLSLYAIKRAVSSASAARYKSPILSLFH